MQVFIGINKNKQVSLHATEPHRNYDTYEWVSNRPYVNTVLQNSIAETVKHSSMTWEMEPEVIEINLSMNYDE